jgi:hypothetical protein
MEVHRRLLKTDPAYRKNRLEIENFTKQYVERNAGAGLRSEPIFIPIVVHVVYNTPRQNISHSQIFRQIVTLVWDFRKQNPNSLVFPEFEPYWVDTRINFYLALRDPDCKATTGITRTFTSVESFTHDDAVKFSASGGKDAWPSDKYLNIWVCNLAGGLLGYAQFPGGPASTDGVVIDYRAIGDFGTATAPFNLGRTATHEIGHWLNLLHIWGDDPPTDPCSGSDEVVDTPNQGTPNFGCPKFPHLSCDNGPNGDMFTNFMDYTDDRCMTMFTAGQSARMEATLAGPRSAILRSDGLWALPSETADLSSWDFWLDQGQEPHPLSALGYSRYASPDIWVRRQNDGFVDHEHQNPEYRPPGSGPNFVYVRVRNRGCTLSSNGTVKLYWAKASSCLRWPAPWDGSITSPALMGGLIGTKATGTVTSGGTLILEFPWYPPNPADYNSFGADKSRFSLLSRIETSDTPPFGMTTPEGPDLTENIWNNNNIVAKIITVVDDLPGGGKMAWVTVGGFTEKTMRASLEFRIPKEEPESVFDFGTVVVDLGEELFSIWQEEGSSGDKIRVVDKHEVILAGAGSKLDSLRLSPNEFYTIGIRFTPFREKTVGNNVFLLDFTQHASDKKGDRLVGCNRLIIKTIASPAQQAGKQPTLVFNGCEWEEREKTL